MHTYDDNCEFTFENVISNFDHYYCVHCGNWFLATFVIRDAYVLHFWHLFDEIIELSWQHILPHFRECWWDHLIMDICLSNIPAIVLALFVMDKIGIRRYDWLGRDGAASFWDWKMWHCHKYLGGNIYVQGLLIAHFLSGFLLINSFLIPPKHFFPVFRLLIWFGFGAMGFRETYIDIETWNTMERKEKPVEGRYRWFAVGILITEVLVCFKYREGTGNLNLDAETPIYIWLPWSATAIFFAVMWLYLRFKPDHTVKYPGIDQVPHGKQTKIFKKD